MRTAQPAVSTESKNGEGKEPASYRPPSRAGTAPITGHFPRQVRNQLKILAIERSCTRDDLMAEAYNDLFAKYGKPEIAPRQPVELEIDGAKVVEQDAYVDVARPLDSAHGFKRALVGRLGYQPSGVIENLDERDPELVYFKRLDRKADSS